MMGKNHVTVNVTAAGAILSVLCYHIEESSFVWVHRVQYSVLEYLIPPEVGLSFSNGIFYQFFIWFSLAVLCFYIGTLLPDIDSETSAMGKVIHIPLQHRTWTHSIWAVILMLLLSSSVSYARWLMLGYVLHLLGDSFSAAGLCFWYPLEQYIVYDSGAFVAPNHRCKLYHAKKKDEWWFVLFVSVFFICLFAWFGIYKQSLLFLFRWLLY